MWAARYFSPRYWAKRFWPAVGAELAEIARSTKCGYRPPAEVRGHRPAAETRGYRPPAETRGVRAS